MSEQEVQQGSQKKFVGLTVPPDLKTSNFFSLYLLTFFIEPLFNQSSTDRELQAVDNECTGNLQSDGWRNLLVKKALANPQHPYHKFNIGNVEAVSDLYTGALHEDRG